MFDDILEILAAVFVMGGWLILAAAVISIAA